MQHVYIIAGPNGAGKTTFAQEFLPHYAKCPNFVNPDMIARGLSPFSPKAAAFKAGRILLGQVRDLARRGVDFAFETTLSGKTYLAFLRDLKKKGYSIHLYFLWIDNMELSLARIKDRVLRGGHDVPSKDVRRRFHRSLSNLFKVYKPLLDSWMLFDNSSREHRLIAKGKNGSIEIVNAKLFDTISHQIGA